MAQARSGCGAGKNQQFVAQFGIRVNIGASGLTLTDATAWQPKERKITAAANPMRRIGNPDDLADAILPLAGDYAKYINAGYLPVDGGTTTW